MRYRDSHTFTAVAISTDVILDKRLSAADLGVYVRFAAAAELYIDPSLDRLVRECAMPREETESALLRLVALGIIEESPLEAGEGL